MESIEIAKDVRKFIVYNYFFGDEQMTFSDDESFLESGIMDSTGILELIEYIEEKYTINIGDDEMVPENLDSVRNLCRFIKLKAGTIIDGAS